MGLWLEENGRWDKNTKEICKRAWARVGMLTKLKYAGVSTEDLLHTYKQFVRVMLEYCSVVWHSSLSEQQSRSLERCQSVCLRVILGDNFISYIYYIFHSEQVVFNNPAAFPPGKAASQWHRPPIQLLVYPSFPLLTVTC